VKRQKLTIDKSDFFPYNGNFNLHYWTGFYTSRPGFKKLIRDFTVGSQVAVTDYSLDAIMASQ
jgi:hypothetical protein